MDSFSQQTPHEMMDMGDDYGANPNFQQTSLEPDNSYRMVRKEYFCFICDKKFKKMVQVQELLDKGLTCDECGQGFVEVIEHGNDMPLRDFVEKVNTLEK